MAVFILLGTLGTHLFGGSAGREGTAVQMGGGIAAAFLRSTRLLGEAARVLLLSGMSAGFGGVFGTPWAGAVFAVEIAQRSRDWRWLPVFAMAALLSDATCRLWGIGHSAYSVAPVPREVWESPATLLLWAGYAAGVGIISGLGARTYLAASTTCTRILKRLFPAHGPRAAAGGVLILGLVWLAGTRDYLGLGVLPQNSNSVTLPGFFEANGEMPPTSGLWKMIFTVVTLTSGFRGGEVTPLFFIGAALGQAVSGVLGAPPDLLAGLGMAALFGAAARAPLSCWILGMELFGGQHALWVGVACAVAWACSGADSLYRRPPKRA
jgi:H+/Cl- antiporter ClcA